MRPKGAKSYLNAEMIGNLCNLMDITDLHISPAEAQEMTLETMNKLYYVYFVLFCCMGEKPYTYPQEETNGLVVPVVTREELRNWLIVRIVLDPVCLT
jgi:hypothetical protein